MHGDDLATQHSRFTSCPEPPEGRLPAPVATLTLDQVAIVGSSTVRTILILAANTKDTERLRLDKEVKKIEQGLERAKRRDQFNLVVKWAVTDEDLRRALLDHEPEIVHFSGHGTGAGKSDPGRDLSLQSGKRIRAGSHSRMTRVKSN